jgi:hypothetical protein
VNFFERKSVQKGANGDLLRSLTTAACVATPCGLRAESFFAGFPGKPSFFSRISSSQGESPIFDNTLTR